MSVPAATDGEIRRYGPIMMELIEWLMGKEGKDLTAPIAVSVLAGTFMLMFAGAPRRGREELLSLARRLVKDCEKHMDETEVRDMLLRGRRL